MGDFIFRGCYSGILSNNIIKLSMPRSMSKPEGNYIARMVTEQGYKFLDLYSAAETARLPSDRIIAVTNSKNSVEIPLTKDIVDFLGLRIGTEINAQGYDMDHLRVGNSQDVEKYALAYPITDDVLMELASYGV